MPLYSYLCKCGNEADVYKPVSEYARQELCPVCERAMKRNFDGARFAVHCFQEYVTSDISGEPIRVTSKSHETAVCAKHGVYRAASDEIQVKKNPPISEKTMGEPFKETFERTRQEMGAELR